MDAAVPAGLLLCLACPGQGAVQSTVSRVGYGGSLYGFYGKCLEALGASLVEPGRALGTLHRSLVEALELYKSSHRKNLKGEYSSDPEVQWNLTKRYVDGDITGDV
jgi:hypothetical protein